MTRIYFATDIHGSEVCWRKFLNAGAFYGADVLILGGDMTGKALVPVVEDGGRFRVSLQDHAYVLESVEEVREMEARIKARGYYPLRVTQEQVVELGSEPEKVSRIFQEQMLATVERWMGLADRKLSATRARCYVCPGNDDQFDVDEIIGRSATVELAEGRVVEVDALQMVSTGWSNPTPWRTYRECSEEELAHRLEGTISQLQDPESAIFNFHCPPFGSNLDEAPALDEELRPHLGGRALRPVGSTAVRDAIFRYQPHLSLHGHIHEGRGAVRLDRTLAINPGSAYEEGVLQGAVVDIDRRHGVRNYTLVTG